MQRQSKKEQKKETQFTEEISPLIDRITELCNKYDMPLLVAVQLYINKTDGVRMAAQSVETKNSVLPLRISSKLLRGEARVSAEGDEAYYIKLADEEGNFNDSFEYTQLETLEEHAAHCSDCKEMMEERVASGEDISNVRIMGDHTDEVSFDLQDIESPMMLGGFFTRKSTIVH
jgi:hypothetical protein